MGYWDVKEVADYTKKAVATIYNYVYRGWIPCFRAGNKLLFKQQEIDLWIATGGNKAAAQKILKNPHRRI